MHSLEKSTEKAILVGVLSNSNGFNSTSFETLAELGELAMTAGAVVVDTMVQSLPHPDVATFIGSGKVEELKQLIQTHDASLVIFDDELSPSQMRNLEQTLETKVIDRSGLILDIFASRANSREGKLQVELAQMKYILPRLTGKGIAMSRLGGGIGTRGPGETKLETDRRHIKSRIHSLSEELKEVALRRNQTRKKRQKDGVQIVCILGYTNAGKSTLLNYLTNAGVLSEDKLFATLDPTARALLLPDGREVIIIDTVGFIRKLPHHLIKAFHSTLEEVQYADLILNVVDASSNEVDTHLKVCQDILSSLNCTDKPILRVYNKCDLVDFSPTNTQSEVYISSKTGGNIDCLLDTMCHALPNIYAFVNLLIPYDKGSLINSLRLHGVVLSEEYIENGIKISANVEKQYLSNYEDCVVNDVQDR